jgi:squalene-associated FAD-dependent desaturase
LKNNELNIGTVYIVGAGLAGLSAAVSCVLNGYKFQLFESTNHAGGRCRSFRDPTLGRTIDNGNHLILSGNLSVKNYLKRINALNSFKTIDPVSFQFIDINSEEQWSLQPSLGWIPWWVLMQSKRIPSTELKDYLALIKFKYADDETIADLINTSRPIFDRLWQPLSQAVLNTDAKEAAAAPIWAMLSSTLLKGRKASRPMLPKVSLSASLVDPAINFLSVSNGSPQFSMRLRSIEMNESYVKSIIFNEQRLALNPQDKVILALPPHEISTLLPNITIPTETRSIVNVHFRINDCPRLPNNAPFIGMIGGSAHWLFRRNDIYSVTVSAANDIAEQTNEQIAKKIWCEVAKVIGKSDSDVPLNRVIKERRATIAQTPEQNKLRPDSRTLLKNLFLAGDWTKTGLPATIEGAIFSGHKAVEILAK